MIVVDASVAIKFVVEEPDSDRALELVGNSEPLTAPDWMLAEAASSIARKVNSEGLDPVKAQRSLALLPEFFTRLHPTLELLESGFSLALRLQHPFYDCLYLALAVAEDAPLVTADRKFVSLCAAAGLRERVRLFGEEGWLR